MKIEQLGPYRIVRELGRGGMGTVYEGTNVETNEPAAVKLLSAKLAREEDSRDRFQAEVEVLRKLNHPNIVRLFGFGDQDGEFFYAMELVDGSSLEAEFSRGRRFDWREVTQIALETCRALRHAHDRGVIHRDIKPGNLLLAYDGSVKLSDFGIARLFGNIRLTNAGSVMGTAEYMAPEQAGGTPADPRADMYSLGAVMYVLLARRPLFVAKSLPEILDKQRHEQPVPLLERAPECPRVLAEIVTQLLEKEPDRRIPNPAVLSRQLEAMKRGLSLSPSASELGTAEQEGPVDDTPSTVTSPDQPGLPPADDPDTPPKDLPETRVTGAFDDDSEALSPLPPSRQQESSGRFTPVAEEELDRAQPERVHVPLISIQTWVLIVGVIAMGLAVSHFLRPPSADALHERITTRTAAGGIDALREAEGDIQQFLSYYADDPRGEQVRRYEKEIELYRLQRKFERRAKSNTSVEGLTPIEHAYLDAVRWGQVNPQRGIAKLQALIDLYGESQEVLGVDQQCLELAKRRLRQLRRQQDRNAAEQLAEIELLLAEALAARKAEPQRAQAACLAIIELYGDKPWAAEVVRRARDALE